ncbi:MAG: TetR/AcrR family transcriptional regulator [Ignavibacteria bacterium]|nr:TetR/AcrR family transcriptional regulator [Ignavibacteria bacterium]
MEMTVNIKLNNKLFLRNPDESELGKKILQYSIILIHRIGFEAFTFKKLAAEIGTTEAGVYRYFENKHRLLLYLVDWYWSWQEYRLIYATNNISDPTEKLSIAIKLLSTSVEDDTSTSYIDEKLLFEIVIMEGAKSYLTRHVTEDNKHRLFKPYKDLCARIADIILECNPTYKYPRSLASSAIEMAHSHNFYVKHLPSLTDFNSLNTTHNVPDFIEDMVFSVIRIP